MSKAKFESKRWLTSRGENFELSNTRQPIVIGRELRSADNMAAIWPLEKETPFVGAVRPELGLSNNSVQFNEITKPNTRLQLIQEPPLKRELAYIRLEQPTTKKLSIVKKVGQSLKTMFGKGRGVLGKKLSNPPEQFDV
jgi:hypothetical protein